MTATQAPHDPNTTSSTESVKPARRPVVISLMDRNVTILGGQEVRWGRVVQALATPNGRDVTILCTNSLVDSWERGEVGPVGTRLTVFTERGSKLRTWLDAQTFALRRIPRGAIVHLTGPGMLVLPAAILARVFKGCTLLTSLTTSRVLPFRKERFPRKGYWMFRAALAASHLVDALNPHIDVATLIDPAKLSIAPCSFSDPSRYQSSGRKVSRVVFAGHFNWQKGSDLLVGIVREWTVDPDCRLVICGTGSYEPMLRDAAQHRPNVEIKHTWALADVLADATVFLSLQQWDNYPSQSLLEAMLCECCVVATDVGDTHLLVRQPWGVRLRADAHPRSYVDAALRLLSMPSPDRLRAGQAARSFVVRHHTRERYMEYLNALWCSADAVASRTRLVRNGWSSA